MTNEQIAKLVDEAQKYQEYDGVKSAPINASLAVAVLCNIIEVLQKRLDRCKRQRDYYNRYSNDEFLKSLEECDKELDEIGSEE